jgi:lactoylglutathione lyase
VTVGIQGFSHLGVCVRDLDVATRFYVEVLGFRQLYSMDFAAGEVAATMERADAFTSRMLIRGDVRVELLWWHDSAELADGWPPAQRRPMTTPGFTHLSFRVDSVDDLVDAAVRCGGAVWPETLTVLGDPDDPAAVRLLYLTDPDGNRIECMAGTPELPL